MPRRFSRRDNNDGAPYRNNFRCPDCGDIFSRADYLREHIDDNHPYTAASLPPIIRRVDNQSRTNDRYGTLAYLDGGAVQARQQGTYYDRAYRPTSHADQLTLPDSQHIDPRDQRSDDYYGNPSRDYYEPRDGRANDYYNILSRDYHETSSRDSRGYISCVMHPSGRYSSTNEQCDTSSRDYYDTPANDYAETSFRNHGSRVTRRSERSRERSRQRTSAAEEYYRRSLNREYVASSSGQGYLIGRDPRLDFSSGEPAVAWDHAAHDYDYGYGGGDAYGDERGYQNSGYEQDDDEYGGYDYQYSRY